MKHYPKILCPRQCGNNAVIDPIFGILPCKKCIANDNVTITRTPEFVNINKMHRIQHQRDKGKRDLLQPFEGGKMSVDFAKAYPKLAKNYFTNKELESI